MNPLTTLRKSGKNTLMFADFMERCKKGEKVRFMTIRGDILSPALLAQTLKEERSRTLDLVSEEVGKLNKRAEEFVPFQKIHYKSALNDLLSRIQELKGNK